MREVSSALAAAQLPARFLFVDDGSTDDTPAVLARLAAVDPRIRWIRLARNFGQQAALAAGLAHADGDAVIVMDADLQDDPAVLPQFIEHWRNGAQVVYAIRSERKEHALRRAAVSAFYWLVNRVAEFPIPRDAGTFALYDRKVVDQINALPETNRYLPGLRAWVGMKQVGIPVPRRARHSGKPVQSSRKLIGSAFDGLLAFSRAPLRLATILGLLVSALAAAALLVVIYWRFIQRSFPAGVGQATIALSLLFLGGVQLLALGIIGEYVGRVYDEVKRRPHYVVAEAHGIAPRSQTASRGA